MPFVIINADDFGLTHGVSQAIMACDANSAMLSTSAMVCVEEADTKLRNAVQFTGGIGLHLQLTQGRPVLEPTEVPTLVDSAGNFPARRPNVNLDRVQVAREWRAQLKKLRSLGIKPDHIDSHHHVHAWPEKSPALLSVMADLARELGIPARSGSREVSKSLRAVGVSCPDVVVSFSDLDADVDALMAVLEVERAAGPSDLVVEIVCHPGFLDSELEALTIPRYFTVREKELRVLLSSDLYSRIRSAGWDTIRYRDLRIGAKGTSNERPAS